MGLYAVATIKDGNSTGIVVSDSIGERVFKWSTKQIIDSLSKGVIIQNIGLSERGIEWKSGSVLRYPSIYLSSGEVERKDNITVLYSIVKSSGLVYVVANYKGELVCISEDKIIQYGSKYTLTNCKVTSRGGKPYISSICGEIERLENKADITIGKRTGDWIVEVRFGVDTVVVPSILNGKKLKNIRKVEAFSEIEAYRIKHLVVESGIELVYKWAFSSLPNIKTAKFMGDNIAMLGVPFKESKEINKIYIGSLNIYKSSAKFSGLRNLNEVKIGKEIYVHERLAFDRCTSLDVQSFIREGLVRIGYMAYKECTQLVDIKLPTTLLRISNQAFIGCTNIKSLTITSSNVFIEGNRLMKPKSADIMGEDKLLLSDSTNAVIYHPYSFPLSRLKALTSENVSFVRMEPTDEEKMADERYDKQKPKYDMLGIRTRKNDTARDDRELLGALTVMTKDSWRKSLIDILMRASKYDTNVYGMYTLTADCVSIEILLKYTINTSKILNTVIGNKYACLILEYNVCIILIDKEHIKERVKAEIKWTDTTEYTQGDRLAKLNIPMTVVTEDSKVSYIAEDGDTLIISYKSGSQVKITQDMCV